MAFSVLEAEYVAATPIYMGNERPDKPAQRLREASFKGVLRFWWRALMWNQVWQELQNEEKALAALKKLEGELFGFATDKSNGKSTGRASTFVLRIHETSAGQKDRLPGNGWRYLLGQGLKGHEPSHHAGTRFLVRLLLKREISDQQLLQLQQALVALGLFGGVGARSRRGVGSLSIHALREDGSSAGEVPQKAGDLPKALQWLGLPATCPKPKFAAFSSESRVDLWPGDIARFGFEFLDWRSYYDHHQRPPVRKRNPNFPDDHDEMLKAAMGRRPARHPERVIFGLPHNYFFRSKKEKVEVNYGTAFDKRSEGKHERHASPYILHAHAFPDGTEGVVQLLLPQHFAENQIAVRHRGNKWKLPLHPDWQVVHDFMNYMNGRKLI